MERQRRVILCILDGWGERTDHLHNSIATADTPVWDSLQQIAHLKLSLDASGEAVGLPAGQMGNSEVGHTCLGLGRIVQQDLPRLNQALADNQCPPALEQFMDAVLSATDSSFQKYPEKHSGKRPVCHVLGLLSEGGIHSHSHHFAAVCRLLSQAGITVHIHAFADGRDTPPFSAQEEWDLFQEKVRDVPHLHHATFMGRYYAMDRDQRWDRTQQAFEAIAEAKGTPFSNLEESIKTYHAQGVGDEFIPPLVYEGYQGIQEGDSLLMVNFRSDRVRQILKALLFPAAAAEVPFTRSRPLSFKATLGLNAYGEELAPYIAALLPKESNGNGLGEILAQKGLKQLRAAETEKYAHVTFFFNGGKEEAFPGEERLLIASPRVTTYDICPEMSAIPLTEALVKELTKKQDAKQLYDFVVVNYANADMVGHTGNEKATEKAIETLDVCLGKLYEAAEKNGYTLVVTADHGNAELMCDEKTHAAHTAHTCNLVPFLVVGGEPLPAPSPLLPEPPEPRGPGLQDVAPTILELMGLPPSSAMTGISLLRFLAKTGNTLLSTLLVILLSATWFSCGYAQIAEPPKKSYKAPQPSKDVVALEKKIKAVQDDMERQQKSLITIKEELQQLKSIEENCRANLNARKKQLMQTFYHLMHVAQYSPVLSVFFVGSLEDWIHSSLLMRHVLPQLQKQNKELFNTLARFNKAHQALLSKQKEIAKEQEKFEGTRRELARLLEAKTFEAETKDLPKTTASHLEDIVTQALLEKEAWAVKETSQQEESPTGSEESSDSASSFSFLFPVWGSEALEKKTPPVSLTLPDQHKNYPCLAFSAPLGARILSPVEGRILYAGKFALHEECVVITHEKHLIVLFGLAHLKCAKGDQVMPGDLVGEMPSLPSDKGYSKTQRLSGVTYLYLQIWSQDKKILNPQDLSIRYE